MVSSVLNEIKEHIRPYQVDAINVTLKYLIVMKWDKH